MGIQIGISAASGNSISDCHVLATRFDSSGEHEGAYEAMIVHGADAGFMGVQSSPAYMDLWRSPGGRVYVAADRKVVWSHTPTQGGGGWVDEPLEGTVRRIDGVDDQLVFAYGAAGDFPMYRFDGSSWAALKAPGLFLKLHGVAPSLVYGVGAKGLIARWNGSGWNVVPTNASGVFRDICVVSEDEMYAVHEGGLWEGSVHGWTLRLPANRGSLLSVCKWRDELWIGTASGGLCRLVGDELVTVKGNISPKSIDGRGGLVMAQDEMVAVTSDGESFRGWTRKKQLEIWAEHSPCWLR